MEQPTSEEKILAALAHASGIFWFLGPIGAVIIWVIQRNKSKYVRYHALQAMGYQVYSYWAWMVGMFIFTFIFIGISLVFAILTVDLPTLPTKAMLVTEIIFFLFIFAMFGSIFLLQFIAAIFCILGRDFRYPVIGSWLQKRFLNEEDEKEAEKWEDAWVGGVCHATAILQIWGMLMPVIAYLSQKDRSSSLKLQSLQAFLFQLIATAVYTIGYSLFFFVYILFFAVLAISGIPSDPNQAVPPELGTTFVLIMVVFTLLWGASMILYPVYLILAGIASIRTLRGHEFRYPILGNMLIKRIKSRSNKAISPTENEEMG